MLSFLNCSRKTAPKAKRSIIVTGTLANVLTPGMPALYLYQGNLIRTSAVKAILEAAPNHVRFETQNSIYTLSFYQEPDAGVRLIA